MPKTLIICDDFLGLEPQLISGATAMEALPDDRVSKIISVLVKNGFSEFLAIRSSAQIEDLADRAAAGVFDTDFFAGLLSESERAKLFMAKLLQVYNSAYAAASLEHWRKSGCDRIPTMPVLI